MKLIQLSRGFCAQVDDNDFNWLNKITWHAIKDKYTYYAYTRINGKSISMHRLIMKTPINMECDHVDHNGLNCQRHNLRNATHGQNGMNKRTWGISKYKGVSYNGKYIKAQICINKKQIYLGNFKTEELAAIAYNEAAKKYHGEFANLNIFEKIV